MIGELNEKEIEAILETIPFEFSVIDKNDKVLAWNKHETRIFKRPLAAEGRDVRNCHPPKSLSKVEQILSEMKKSKRDMAQFYLDLPVGKNKEKNKILIQYFALRDKNNNYLGCLEISQNITPIQNIRGEKRSLD